MGRLPPAILFAESTLKNLVLDPLVWAIVLGGIALYALIPRSTKVSRSIGVTLGAISVGLFLLCTMGFFPTHQFLRNLPLLPLNGTFTSQLVFSVCALVTIVSAVCTITMRSPVYAAIWFAVTLIGVSGLLLFQGAQFLGLATIVVYAGAIVVTFLFVVMLAQSDGHSTYDRITWGHVPRAMSVIAAVLMVSVLTFAVGRESQDEREQVAMAIEQLNREASNGVELTADQLANVRVSDVIAVNLRSDVSDETLKILQSQLPAVLTQIDAWQNKPLRIEKLSRNNDLLDSEHMAHLGAEMFGRHLISVELAGTLLLVALVGAISIVIQGRSNDQEESTTS
jgi:NADH-quinone oxidoreductase subunit J